MTEIERLKSVVQTLRSERGCAWDRAQTHESLKPPCIEEAAEVICGINILSATGDPTNLKEELGDLLLQVVFHAVIAEEEGLFTFDDVAKYVSDKMVRRHPHVFAGVQYASDEERNAACLSGARHERGRRADRPRQGPEGLHHPVKPRRAGRSEEATLLVKKTCNPSELHV